MPGMMDTLLNIGLCDAAAHGLLRITGNPRLVWDSYRRLIQSFSEVVCGAASQPFEAALAALLARERVERFQELDYLSLAEVQVLGTRSSSGWAPRSHLAVGDR